MEAEVSETLVFSSTLIWLIAQGDLSTVITRSYYPFLQAMIYLDLQKLITLLAFLKKC